MFPDAILRVCPPPPVRPRVFLPWGTAADTGARLRGEGYATIGALTPSDDPAPEAARLLCTHIARDGAAVALNPEI